MVKSIKINLDSSLKISPEVRDLWICPDGERYSPITPRVSIESLADAITQAVQTHIPLEMNKRKQVQMESLTVDDRGVAALINDKCYRDSIALIR